VAHRTLRGRLAAYPRAAIHPHAQEGVKLKNPARGIRCRPSFTMKQALVSSTLHCGGKPRRSAITPVHSKATSKITDIAQLERNQSMLAEPISQQCVVSRRRAGSRYRGQKTE
jgi:hypothetical protein